jgi:hypothetical protein
MERGGNKPVGDRAMLRPVLLLVAMCGLCNVNAQEVTPVKNAPKVPPPATLPTTPLKAQLGEWNLAKPMGISLPNSGGIQMMPNRIINSR